MNDPTELDESALEARRSQANSYWKRGLFFVALEVAAIVGFWKLIPNPHVPPCFDAAFAVLGLVLTVAWLLSNRPINDRAEYRRQSSPDSNPISTSARNSINAHEETVRRYRFLAQVIPALLLPVWVFLLCSVFCPSLSLLHKRAVATSSHKTPPPEYFDAHNHGFSAILPYYAYADLPAFIKNPTDPAAVDLEHRRQLWDSLVKTGLGDKTVLTGADQRYAPGAVATLRAYGPDTATLTSQQIDGALQRVLTSTPWTEFDSAYAFRGGPVDDYLNAFARGGQTKGQPNDEATDGAKQQVNDEVCDASILELAVTDTAYSEQFLSFLNGWGIKKDGPIVSSKLDAIHCFTREPKAMAARGELTGKITPVIKVLLMTYTSDLGATSDGKHWRQYGARGQCDDQAELREQTFDGAATWLSPPPEVIETALLGENFDGRNILEDDPHASFFNGVIGIDTAGPETTCFTPTGMDNYKDLVRAVYHASIKRRKAGWHGKLLVHTHVGEGAAVYQINLKNMPKGEKAKSVFTSIPKVWIDPVTHLPVQIEQAKQNVKMLIRAVEQLKSEIGDLDDYVIFRFGHVTNADLDDALDMRRLNIEADINLESNISTRSFYPEGLPTLQPDPVTEPQQFADNDIAAKLLNSGDAIQILSDHALKNMLAAGVRTLLGSDGGGEENSDIRREYSLAQQLIGFWRAHDSAFPRNISIDTINNNVQEHLEDMQSDRKCDCH